LKVDLKSELIAVSRQSTHRWFTIQIWI